MGWLFKFSFFPTTAVMMENNGVRHTGFSGPDFFFHFFCRYRCLMINMVYNSCFMGWRFVYRVGGIIFHFSQQRPLWRKILVYSTRVFGSEIFFSFFSLQYWRRMIIMMYNSFSMGWRYNFSFFPKHGRYKGKSGCISHGFLGPTFL